jgi:hypothetical protein
VRLLCRGAFFVDPYEAAEDAAPFPGGHGGSDLGRCGRDDALERDRVCHGFLSSGIE